jgi:hypothetical protein
LWKGRVAKGVGALCDLSPLTECTSAISALRSKMLVEGRTNLGVAQRIFVCGDELRRIVDDSRRGAAAAECRQGMIGQPPVSVV